VGAESLSVDPAVKPEGFNVCKSFLDKIIADSRLLKFIKFSASLKISNCTWEKLRSHFYAGRGDFLLPPRSSDLRVPILS